MSNIISPPKVVIVGRTNVGKSTLFNKLIEDQKSLISDIAGTTRDRFEADCIWRGQVIRMVDTGGLDRNQKDNIEKQISMQAYEAIKESDLVIFIVDAQAGPQQEDRDLAKKLLKLKQPVLLIANKADNEKIRKGLDAKEWHSFPYGRPTPVSARRGIGTGDLLDNIYENLKKQSTPPVDIADAIETRVAVIGRPNVGKSSLLNSALGQDRFITDDSEHTTREPNDTHIAVDGRNYLMVDTAGIRKMARVNSGKSKLEISGVDRSIKAMERANVVLFVIDISKSITSQDKHLGGIIADSGASAIIIANKWDKIPEKDSKTINKYEAYLRAHLPMLDYAPIVFTSASTGKRVQQLFDVIDEVFKNRFTQLHGQETHAFISEAIAKHKPSRGKGVAHPDIKSFIQVKVNPPTFVLTIKQARVDALNKSYLRFLENLLRDKYGFGGSPIKIFVRGKKKSHTT
ncbi:ribosome biogenesis GTPase Der [Candidatus Uhrbacteria bacterium CG_4_9_14_0_2_um_filter_41_50]|uniref:GTPase Der n=1 Tax=Candidatus Uhrbacteria bacterium CG_4_9_14_0_2_um_filter_41_50 TaxID=1975031 RepID=A0A2M8ENX8_9BACT|nr:MAG: ribosome biogenesis GTPase Der [Candidatus Uhrbacteria bacterium CG_4_10_14_3_um_filter_41_21]PIZ54812.1 MAG: ribosome biogenesis GTPase Der [Candidatus Uhrbacteria bacterium CG_4_10_14_0_2_um_filter_41_21]PJB84607.1 MAG: ribosome biogenesis GTPase Der [Candidatus Uhrbacteria bacterium CG_4_9_14_0_8_um_filter_41_16]PJC24401.1 MAG: ribosome biogenesis GTPase Der [Candidatus Uhrbacteria bacterium CG_4_9_14_0_2_um_filter_41_50]PJE75164.1 MAG: ribosome biogenesis GTPase Der [Candidatus Uhrb